MAIPVNEPLLDGNELKYVKDCVDTAWISSAGKYIERFENEWAGYCDRKYGVAVANGTVALQLAAACLELKKGDEVIMPSFTIISCALAVIYNGAVPVLVDCDPDTWCMDVDQIEQKITGKTKAIMPVHIFGHPVDMDPVLELAKKYKLAVIEDAAQVHGAEYLSGRTSHNPTWKKCGAMGDFSCFSFYANKLITTGEGGMLLTDDENLAAKARAGRNLCFGDERRFEHEKEGFNFRLTNIQAALGLAQVERIDRIVERKRFVGEQYRQRLGHISGLNVAVEREWARNVYWMNGVVLDESVGMDAKMLAAKLKALGVDTRPFFLGMHQQPVFLKRGLFAGETCPITERIGSQGLYLPSGLALTDEQLSEVCDRVCEVLK